MMHFGVQWFEEIQPLAYGDFMRMPWQAPPCIKICPGNSGCTSNNAIQLAHFLGYDPLFLIGVDFGYPEGKERCIRWVLVDGEWENIGADSYSDRSLHKADNGVLTTEEQIEYKSAMMAVYKWDKPQLFDCSEGIITELPKLNFEEVVKKNGRGFEEHYRTGEEIERISNEYADSRKKLQDKGIEHRKGEDPIATIKRIASGNTGKIKG